MYVFMYFVAAWCSIHGLIKRLSGDENELRLCDPSSAV